MKMLIREHDLFYEIIDDVAASRLHETGGRLLGSPMTKSKTN